MRIILPWPTRSLWPNTHVHWRHRHKASQTYKSAAHWACLEAKARPLGADQAQVSITFNPPDRGRRDLDNLLAAIKHGLDVIAQAIAVDDSKWTIAIAKGEPVKGGQVIVEVRA